jgi:predicted RNA methylase
MATTNNGKDGGLLKGKPHYDKNGKSLGGIKAIVTDTKQMVELEGGEVIINKEASKKHWKELSRINQSAGNGVPILPPDKAMGDTEEYKQGGRTIEFNPNHIPQKWVYDYAKKIKDKHPKIWALGGNEFGNTAFENLERALKRGYWTENEEWMYVKWQSFNARHKGDFRIAGVIANLKWLNKVDKGWDFMKHLIESEIKKKENKLETGGELAKGIKSEREHIGTATKLYKHEITPKQAPESIAKEHLAEDSQYYTKLEEFESKFDTGGGVEQKPTHKEFLVKYYINTGKKHNVKTYICAQNRNEAIDIAKKDDDRYTELISCKPTGNTSWSSSCNKEDAEFDENDEGADEEKHFDSNYKPIFWHLTQSEFCEYAENYEVDTRLDGTKARLECKDFYKYAVVLPLLDDSAERNVFLLAVETGLLPYEKVKEIIESVGAWKESNRFVKQLLDYDRVKNYSSNIWLIPKDLYLSADYYKNNFTKKVASRQYDIMVYKYSVEDDRQLREFIEKGIVKLKDIEARLSEANTKTDRYIEKLRGYAKTFSSKNKLKALKLLLDEDLPIKKEFKTHEDMAKDMRTYTDAFQPDVERRIAQAKKENEELEKEDENKELERKKSLFPENERNFISKLIKDNYADVKYNKVKLQKLANEFGIKEQNLAKELAELSISFVARVYAHNTELTPKERYEKIVKLYESQVNLSHRTSESIMLQQYSTPAPIGYLAGLFCGFDNKGGNYFEPSAGNGLLTIAGKVKDFTVNEIDSVRNRNLSVLGFKKVLKQDASEPFKDFEHKFDAVITNPPFGKTEVVTYGKSDIKSLEQVMSLRALDTMKDNGRCAIIIGGHTEYDKEGRIQSGKNRTYFVYLYKHYNVMDVINISGRHLYSRQGTAFNTRLILIDGRKETPSGFPPLIENPIPMNEINSPTPVDNFDVLWERINKSI